MKSSYPSPAHAILNWISTLPDERAETIVAWLCAIYPEEEWSEGALGEEWEKALDSLHSLADALPRMGLLGLSIKLVSGVDVKLAGKPRSAEQMKKEQESTIADMEMRGFDELAEKLEETQNEFRYRQTARTAREWDKISQGMTPEALSKWCFRDDSEPWEMPDVE